MSDYTFTDFHLFGGIGGGALGFRDAKTEFQGHTASFQSLGGVDCDPHACRDFQMLTGYPEYQMDLFSRADYIAYHGTEPPPWWREVTPDDIRRITGGYCPDVLFASPPCKGFSGLLPNKAANSEKYQALNRLTIRGIKLALEAFKEDLPGFILLENVPRITSRGASLLAQIKTMLSAHGYVFHEGYHDCGELGGLGQRRRRYLLIARNQRKISNFVYLPPRQRLKSIGEVIGPLPLPGDPAGGPMHRLSRLQWKTWLRLALIPAGKDWRALEKIAPEQYRLLYIPRGGGSYGVQQWFKPAATVTGSSSVKGSNATAVADPRLGYMPREGVYRIQRFDEPSTTVTGLARVNTSNGAACVSDPRLPMRDSRHPGVYQVVKFAEPGPCITGTKFGSGAPAVADPRLTGNVKYHDGAYGVNLWDQSAPTVTGGSPATSSGKCVADPRLTVSPGRYSNKFQLKEWNEPAATVTGTPDVQAGAQSIADPRLGCNCRNGSYGVLKWDAPATTITGADIHAGSAAVADVRIPEDNEQGVWIIISPDGTWHRPFTTWELLALQGFPVFMPDGSPVVLFGNSDASWRERIGNAVPPRSAKAIATEILRTLLLNLLGTWELSSTPIWVAPEQYLGREHLITFN